LQTTTNYTSGEKPIACEVFGPDSSASGGAIVIAYGSDGMIDNLHGQWATMLREYATSLAEKGFISVIPDYFLRTGTAAGSIDYQHGGGQIVAMHRNDWAAALNDAVTHVKTLAGVDTNRVGLLGFSLGGHLCLRVRSTAKVLVEFFAPLLDGIGTGGGSGLRAQIHHGTGDSLVPFESNATPIEKELRNGGAATEVNDYRGAGHGFVGTDAANTSARSQSKARTIAFFESNL
jgi:dienelactone hydrolase